jgi:fusaric acid resistance family protein
MSSVEAQADYTARHSVADLLAKSSRQWQWPLEDVFGDLRVRSGIKFGLAALLALYVAEVLRLEHPDWSVLTVLSMMSVPYVGSISILAITQAIGTIAGALVGIWLVGDYASTPAIFLTLFFFVLAFSAYKFGQAQASPVSLGYYLVGLTTIAVTTFGLSDPAQVWQTGISRVLEILDGATSSLVVTTLLWPRSGREEFEEVGRAALKTTSNLFSVHMNAYLQRQTASVDVEQIHWAFGERLIVLRNLLQVGSRESTVFQTWLSDHSAFLTSVTRLFYLVLDLSRNELKTPVLSLLESELEAVAGAISKEFDILTQSHRADEKLGSSGPDEAFAAFEEKVSELRAEDGFRGMQFENGVGFARGFVVLSSMRDELNNIRALMQSLPALGQSAPAPKLTSSLLPTIDWDWVKIAVKSSSAVVIAILLLMWINPPGAPIIPLVTWLLTLLRRPFLRAGGMGDLRGIQNSFLAALGLVAWVALLILLTPFLADYPAMNAALFLMMFVVGFTTARSAGIGFWTQVGMVAIYAFVGLNPQQPVPTQTIIDTFVGFITGMTIATVVGRVFWPVLPQMVMRDNLLAIFAANKALLNGGADHEEIQKRLATLPVEAFQASRQIRIAGYTAQEKARLGVLIRGLQTLSTRTLVLASRRHDLPEIVQAVLQPRFERLEVEFKQTLDAFAECFRQGDCRHQLPRFNGALSEMEEAVNRIRKSEILKGRCLETPSVHVLELADHYHATAQALEECRRLVGALKIHRYWGHCGL